LPIAERQQLVTHLQCLTDIGGAAAHERLDQQLSVALLKVDARIRFDLPIGRWHHDSGLDIKQAGLIVEIIYSRLPSCVYLMLNGRALNWYVTSPACRSIKST
jgi:hypothetical protein